MAKLVFYYGVVSSSKTAQLLLMAHNYDNCNKKVITIKPFVDTRSTLIETRAKVPSRKPDIIIKDTEHVKNYLHILSMADVVMVDEVQFMTESQIDELRDITIERNIDVLCFGLRTDFNTKLFAASKRLFELADDLIEVKTICSVCGKHASFNKKVKADKNGQLLLPFEPGWDNFEPRCFTHYKD